MHISNLIHTLNDHMIIKIISRFSPIQDVSVLNVYLFFKFTVKIK